MRPTRAGHRSGQPHCRGASHTKLVLEPLAHEARNLAPHPQRLLQRCAAQIKDTMPQPRLFLEKGSRARWSEAAMVARLGLSLNSRAHLDICVARGKKGQMPMGWPLDGVRLGVDLNVARRHGLGSTRAGRGEKGMRGT